MKENATFNAGAVLSSDSTAILTICLRKICGLFVGKSHLVLASKAFHLSRMHHQLSDRCREHPLGHGKALHSPLPMNSQSKGIMPRRR